MTTRGVLLASLVAVCLTATACQKIKTQTDPTKFGDTIPLEYGNLIAATTNSADPRWVTLWFEKPDKTLVIVGVDQYTWKVWMEPREIGRK